MLIHELEVRRRLIMLGMTGWNVQMFSRQVYLGYVLLLQYGTDWALGMVGFGWVRLGLFGWIGYDWVPYSPRGRLGVCDRRYPCFRHEDWQSTVTEV